MALYWNWSEKVGEAVFEFETDNGFIEKTMNLYNGNAYLIIINEYQENGTDMYNMFSFFVDKAHMNRCLGLEKGSTNILNHSYSRLKKLKLNKKKCKYFKTILAAFASAFDNLEIEIFTEEEK